MKRTNLLEYFREHPRSGKKYFDLQLNFVDLSLLSTRILLCFVYLLCRVSVRYVRENAAFKDAKTLRERYYVCARFLFERNQCEMKIRARDWWFFTCFFSFS